MLTDFIHKTEQIIEENLNNEKFGPEELATLLGISHSTLHRKIKEITGKTISQFIREKRLDRAKELLTLSQKTGAEIAYEVGFGSPSYFNRCFHDLFGISPGEFKKKQQETVAEEKNVTIDRKRKRLLLPASLLFILIIFMVFNYNKLFLSSKTVHEKAVAILPYEFSGESENNYKANGMMEEIINDLAKIEDLRVLDLTNTELHSSLINNEKQSTQNNIGALLKVTFQIINNEMFLFVKLVHASDGTILFSEKYSASDEGLFHLQNKIAQTIAHEMNANITDQENQLIEKIPTVNLTAYDFFQRGREEQWKYWLYTDSAAAAKAKAFYCKALDYDSTFARAYTGLALLDWRKTVWNSTITKSYLDTIFFLTKKALSFDNDLAEGYFVLGEYYRILGEKKLAEENYNRAIQLNPNDWMAYMGKMWLFAFNDAIKTIEFGQKAASLYNGIFLPDLMRTIGLAYLYSGFPVQSETFFCEALKLDDDSLEYYYHISKIEIGYNNLEKTIELLLKAWNYDQSRNKVPFLLAYHYSEIGKFKEALMFLEKYMQTITDDKQLDINNIHRIAYIFYKNGYEKEAEYYIELQKKRCLDAINSNRYYYEYSTYDLAAVFAFQGDKEKALEFLNIFNKKEYMPAWIVYLIQTDPLFDNIRTEPEFIKIRNEIELKYEAEHERVKKWLIENNLLPANES